MISSNAPVYRRSPRPALMALALSVGLLLGQPLVSLARVFGGGKTQAQAWPTRDFLPPVASINPSIDTKTATQTGDDVEPVTLSAVTSPVIHTSPKVDRLDSELTGHVRSEQLSGVLDIQQKIDTADLEYLWQATVEKNPVIRFSLEKLASPPDLQTKQSSKFLSKSLSTLISGATLAATMMMPNAGTYQNMGTMAVNNALQNMVTGKTHAYTESLSPTEQIQMAGLIDELKAKLIQNYQNYKNTLQTLADSHESTIKNNNLYSKALASKNDLAIMAAGTAYYQALMSETALRQKAKIYRLELERLAGQDAVSRLELTAHIDDGTQSASSITTPVAPITPANPVAPSDIAPQPEDIGPPAPSKPINKKPAKATRSSSNLPTPRKPVAGPPDLQNLPQPMEIGPSLNMEGSATPEAPMAVPAARQKTIAGNESVAIPLPIPEILRHD